MRLTRWKLMAGVLGLSMCGLAALAEPACRTVGLTRRADDPKGEPTPGAVPLPVAVPSPPPATEVPPPVIPPVDDKKPAPPPVPVPVPDIKPTDLKPVALPPINDAQLPPAVSPKLLEDVHKIQNPPVPLPSVTERPSPAPITTPAPIPFAPPTPAVELPKFSEAPLPVVPVADSKPAPLPEPKRADPPSAFPAPKVEVIPPATTVGTVPPQPAGVTAKKLKVTLHLSDDKPWFEVRDGDEVVLKVTAGTVQLSAAAEKGKPAGALAAVDGVTFRTLGGYGTCDELHVMPGTGEVVVSGKVTVTSNWGKSETTATADKMTFRLGGDAKK